jgi:hypothetical protein
MLELKNESLVFRFPEVHKDAVLTVTLVRTLRIPDDGKKYPLPPGLGRFPGRHVDDYAGRVPEKWSKHGGVIVPMYQSEALWLQFSCGHSSEHGRPWPFAIRVATGKTSAVTGKQWKKEMRESDYLVAPEQKWLDGYVVAEGVVRQFVAAPLGQGFTAEEQITGKAEFGGLQIEARPMTLEAFERRWPKRPPIPVRSVPMPQSKLSRRSRGVSDPRIGGTVYTSCSIPTSSGFNLDTLSETTYATNYSADSINCLSLEESMRKRPEMYGKTSATLAASVSELGLAPGGTMEQQVFSDPYGIGDWSKDHKGRCFVHLLNSMSWRAVTGENPPTVPFTAADYSSKNYPWYEHYRDDLKAEGGTSKTASLKGVVQLEKEKGVKILPENETATVASVLKVGPAPRAVRDGVWK